MFSHNDLYMGHLQMFSVMHANFILYIRITTAKLLCQFYFFEKKHRQRTYVDAHNVTLVTSLVYALNEMACLKKYSKCIII